MSKLMTRPALQRILLGSLALYFQGGNRLDPKEYPAEFSQLVQQHQNNIDWKQLFSGWFSWLWAHRQHAFYRQYKLLKNLWYN